MVVHQPVAPACPLGQLVHDLLDDPGQSQVVRVRSLTGLEEHIGVLRRPADDRGFRREAAATEGEDILIADQGPQIVVFEKGDLVDLVRGSEAVEEVEERHARPERGGMRHEGEVVRLLDGAGREHRPPRRPGVHHVAVVTEDREGVSSESASSDVDDRGCQLAGDLEHVRNHQEESLRRREGRRQGTLLEGAVHRTRRAALGLHLDHVGNLAPQVRPFRGRPVVGVLRHRRGGGDREDRDHLAHRIRDARGRFVAVEALPPLAHS